MAAIEQTTSGDGHSEPGPHPGRDLPPPPIDEPPGDCEPDQPPVREPVRPEGNPPQIA